jgi:hypothetical protein
MTVDPYPMTKKFVSDYYYQYAHNGLAAVSPEECWSLSPCAPQRERFQDILSGPQTHFARSETGDEIINSVEGRRVEKVRRGKKVYLPEASGLNIVVFMSARQFVSVSQHIASTGINETLECAKRVSIRKVDQAIST